MSARLPRGVVCPLATPLDDEERLDERALQGLLDHILPDLDGLLVLGSSAEYALLRPAVQERVIEAVVAHVNGAVPIFVGVGDTGTVRAVDNLRRLCRPPVDLVAATSGFYYPVTDQAALERHFLTLAEAAPVPLILYNIPQNTASNLLPATFERLARHPNIVAMKDSWGDMIQFHDYLNARPDGFPILQGREQLSAASLWLGAEGVVSALANFAPWLMADLQKAVESGDRAAAIAAQREVTRVAALFDQGHWLSALKAAIAHLGLGTGRAARPLPELTPAQIARIRELMPSRAGARS